MGVDYKPVYAEIDNDDNTEIFHVFEMRIGMNDFDRALHRHRRGQGSDPRSGLNF